MCTNTVFFFRLVLVSNHKDPNKRRHSRLRHRPNGKMSGHLKNVGKSKSLDSSDIFHSSCQSPSFIATEKQILEQIEPAEKNPRVESEGGDKNTTNNHNNNNKNKKSSKRSKSSNNRMTAKEFFSSPLMRRKKDSSKGKGNLVLLKSPTK